MKKMFIVLMLVSCLFVGVAAANAACTYTYFPNPVTKVVQVDYNCDGWWDYDRIYKLIYGRWVFSHSIYY